MSLLDKLRRKPASPAASASPAAAGPASAAPPPNLHALLARFAAPGRPPVPAGEAVMIDGQRWRVSPAGLLNDQAFLEISMPISMGSLPAERYAGLLATTRVTMRAYNCALCIDDDDSLQLVWNLGSPGMWSDEGFTQWLSFARHYSSELGQSMISAFAPAPALAPATV